MIDPPAGAWFKEQAAELVTLAVPALTPPTCHVHYDVAAETQGLFLSQLFVRNTGSKPVKGWELRWAFGTDEHLLLPLNARATQKRSVVTATNYNWNKVIAPGRTETFGVLGLQKDATHDEPVLFFLNGGVCNSD
jgi:endoglucanase